MVDEKIKRDDDFVYIGTKSFVKYVTSVIMQFLVKKKNKVTIKARGKFISKAVDVAEVVKKKQLKNIKIATESIKINSEGFENKEGKRINVSTIEITLKKE